MCDACKSQESGEVFEFGIFLHTETATRSANVITNTKIDSKFSPLPGEPFHRMIFCDECIRARRKRDNIRTVIFIAAFLVPTVILLVFAITGKNTGPDWGGAVIFGILTSICLFGLLTKTPLSDLFKKEVVTYARERDRNSFWEKDKYNRRLNEVIEKDRQKKRYNEARQKKRDKRVACPNCGNRVLTGAIKCNKCKMPL